MLENLIKTHTTCLEYHKKKGNKGKVKSIQKRIRDVKKKNLFCEDKINSDISNTK